MRFGLQINRNVNLNGELDSDNFASNPWTGAALLSAIDSTIELTPAKISALMADISTLGFPQVPTLIPGNATTSSFSGMAIINSSGALPFKVSSALHRLANSLFVFSVVNNRLFPVWPNALMNAPTPVQLDAESGTYVQGSTIFPLNGKTARSVSYESLNSVGLNGDFQDIPGVTRKIRPLSTGLSGMIYESQELVIDRSVDFRDVVAAFRALGVITPPVYPDKARAVFTGVGDVATANTQFITNWDLEFDENAFALGQLNETYVVVSTARFDVSTCETPVDLPFGVPATGYGLPSVSVAVPPAGATPVIIFPLSYIQTLGNLSSLEQSTPFSFTDQNNIPQPTTGNILTSVTAYPSTLKDPQLFV